MRKCSACSEQCTGKLGTVSSTTTLNMAAVGSNSYHGGWVFSISTTVQPTLLCTVREIDMYNNKRGVQIWHQTSLIPRLSLNVARKIIKLVMGLGTRLASNMKLGLPNICSVCIRFTLDNFRGHPVGGSMNRFQPTPPTANCL